MEYLNMVEQLSTNLNNGTPQAVEDQGGGVAAGIEAGRLGPALQATPLQPKRKVDLSTAILPDLGKIEAVESLAVRELKGVGATFTPNLEAALIFFGLVYKAPGEFEAVHQVIAGPLQTDRRVMSRARRIAFVPALDWSAFEIVLYPVKLTTYGQRVLVDLQKLLPQFPHFKTFVQWNETKRRHVVYRDDLTAQEAGLIDKLTWPTQEQILDALSATAFDNIESLAAANEDVRTLLASKEVN